MKIFAYYLPLTILVPIFLFTLWAVATKEETGSNSEEQKSVIKAAKKSQRDALIAWVGQLKDTDYDPTHWSETMRSSPSDYFEHYVSILSDTFKEHNAMLNFALVGACDGTNDRTIRDRYVPNKHWRGVFVEPFEMNYKDLVNFMTEHGVMDRTHTIHAAATFQCNSTTLKMKRPTFEEKNKSLPHWMRRQIGAVVPFDKMDRPASGGWIFEYTRCLNGLGILADWASTLSIRQQNGKKENDPSSQVPFFTTKNGRIKPHILKVDVEGHDYEVLMGFLSDEVPTYELPLLISFEAKSITKYFDRLRDHLIKRGYSVSHLGNDGFALLHGDKVISKSASSSKSAIEDGGDKGEDGSDNSKKRTKKKKTKGSKRMKTQN